MQTVKMRSGCQGLEEGVNRQSIEIFYSSETICMKLFSVITYDYAFTKSTECTTSERTLISTEDYGQRYTKVSSSTVTNVLL